MASGTITLKRTGSGFLNGRIQWESVSNGTSANTSTVTATLQIQRGAQNTTTGTFKGTFTVGATNQNINQWMELPSNTWVTVKTITVTVGHSTNGAGSCYLYAKIDGPTGTTMGGTSVSGSATVALDAIARFAIILSGEDFTDEGNPTITYSNPAGSAVSRLQACISLDGTRADVPYRDLPTDGDTYTFNLTNSERNTLRSASPNSNTLDVKFCIRSTIDSVNDSNSVKATMSIVNANPSASISVEDTNSTTIALTGNSRKLIALHSIARVTMTSTAQKGATIPSDGIKITHGSTVLTGSGTLNPVKNNDITFKVTDSRGNEANGSVTDAVIPYINPTIVVKNSMPDGNGNMSLVATGRAYTGSFGSKTNSITIRYRYRLSPGDVDDYCVWKAFSNVTWDGNNFTATEQITGLDYTKKYIFQAAVEDSLHAYPGVISNSKSIVARPVFDWSENDFKFNVPVYDQTGELIGNTADEWQNPPLVAATQYGTRERHLGKRVYVKLVDLGSLPNTSTKAVSYNTADDVTAFAFEVFARSNSSSTALVQKFPLAKTFDGTIIARANVTDKSVEVKTFEDLSHYTGFAKIKYTKG